MSLALAGVTEAAFATDAVRAAFVTAAAASLGVPPGSVAITGASAVAAGSALRRRLTQTTSDAVLEVDLAVLMLTASAADGLASRAASALGGAAFVAALQSAGIPTTGVSVPNPPTVTPVPVPPSPPALPPPPPAPPPPAGCGVVWQCFAGVACASTSACGACPLGLAGDGRTCAPCALRVTLSPSFGGAASPRAADATLSAVVSAADAGCNASSGYTFAWRSNATDGGGAPLPLVAAAAGPSLALPARTLRAGQTAAFSITACLAGAAAPTCANATLAFAVTPTPLVPLLGGGGGIVGGAAAVLLSGASSYDPDDARAALSYAWACARAADGAACASSDGTRATLGTAATQSLLLAGAPGGAAYTVTLTVSAADGSRSSSVNSTLTVVPGAIPLVSIAGNAVLAGAKADPSAQLVLFANATAGVPGAVATRWSVAAQRGVGGPLLNLSDARVCATPVTSVSLVIRAGALAPGGSYTFTLTATDAAGGIGSANATVTMSSPPRSGWAEVLPSSGIALSTPFLLTAAGWSADDDELPLTYSVDCFVNGDDASAAPLSLTGGAFQASPTLTAQLPAGAAAAGGAVVLRVTVRSVGGATASANASALVAWPAFEDAAAANAFVDAGAARATAALQGGDASSALQLVGGMAALLNSGTASGGGGTTDNDAAATAQRASLLAIVAAAVSQGAGTAAAPAALESTASLVQSLVSSSAQLSSDGAASALSVLRSVAGAGAAVTPAAAQSVAASLSFVALSAGAGGGASASNASASASTHGSVLGVLDDLAASQARTLAVAGQDPVSVRTAQIQMSLSLDDPSSATSRLATANLSAPGSASAFEALPAGALAALAARGAPVSTHFLSLAFDAHGGAQSNNRGGVTRLAFFDAGAAVPVANLPAPLRFSVPASTLPAGSRAACSWWNDADGNYSSAGCASLPSPFPPGHQLSFVSGFVATAPASLAMAWEIASGPLLAGCAVAFLDCGNATDALRVLQLDPSSPLSAPVLDCAGVADPAAVLRAYVGADCALRRADNAARCGWDVVSQSFAGAGCVAANATFCACTHLTDFTSSPAVNIPVCSLSDLVGLNPADLVTKLRLLFIVVIVLFGVMLLGAALGFGLDRRERRAVLSRLHDVRAGFRMADGGACVWRFGLDPLTAELAAPSGPATVLAAIFGLPYARLRIALPDEMFTTRLGDALGRKQGFSLAGLQATSALHAQLLSARRRSGDAAAALGAAQPPVLSSSLSRRDALAHERLGVLSVSHDGGAAAAGDLQVDAAPPPPAPEEEKEHAAAFGAAAASADVALEEMVGTSLVLAFLQVTQLMPVVELSQRRAAAAAHFGALATPAGWSFDDTCAKFVTLLSPGVLNTRDKWFVKARLWRLILSQSTDGSWAPSATVAFALEARAASEVASVQLTWFEALKDRLADAGEVAGDMLSGDLVDILDGTAAQHTQAGAGGKDEEAEGDGRSLAGHRALSRRNTMLPPGGMGGDGDDEDEDVLDDPLRCSARALRAAMPRRLAQLAREDAGVDAERVWTTMCCAALLSTLNTCWLWTDGDLYPAEEVTMVDAADAWVAAHAAARPALAAALADGAVAAAAARAVTAWHRAWERRVSELRRSEAVTSRALLSHVHRASTELLRALCMRHSTFSIFLSSPLDGLQRWQMWMIIVTLVIEQLLVNIWMCVRRVACAHRFFARRPPASVTLFPLRVRYYARGQNCCAEVQALLGCAPVGPCRGVEGNCGDLVTVFATTPIPPYFPNGLADYTCIQFPDDANPRDSLIVALIALAIALPVTQFIASCFEIANDSEAPESWLFYGGVVRLACGAGAHRRWRYGGPAGQPRRFVRWYVRSVDAPTPETVGNLWESFKAWLSGAKPPWIREAEEAEEAAAAAGDDTADGGGDSKKPRKSSSGVGGGGGDEARDLRRAKRRLTAVGIGGVLLIWAIFAWFIFTCACAAAACFACGRVG
jgi:hypothetical protein